MTTPTILAVEDDEDLRVLLSLILEAEGYTVTTAANGLEALARVREHMPDLILLDMKMPVMSGAEFAAVYLAQHRDHARRAPIVVMTAAEHASRRCQEISANDFLSKPFAADELVRMVKRYSAEPPRPSGSAAEA